MKAISKYFAMCAIALLGLANTSCMSDDIESTAACNYSVVLEYKVGGSATETRAATRAAVEDGSEDLNENKIERLDLFVFKPDGSRVKQVTFNSADVKGSPTTEYKHKTIGFIILLLVAASVFNSLFVLVPSARIAPSAA